MKEQIKKAQKTYDKFAKIYADYTFNKVLQFQLNKFISLLPKDAKVLDLGCGAGRDLAYFAEEGFNVMGIDNAKGMIEQAKERVANIKIQKQDFRKTKFKDESFHGLWCMASFSDIEKKEAPKTLTEFSRILAKGGILYIAVKEGEGQKVLKKPRYDNAERFYSLYTQKEMENLATEAGFEIVSATTEQDGMTNWVELFLKKK